MLGIGPAATLVAILQIRNDLATKSGLAVSSMRTEMEHKFATKDDLLEMRRDFDLALRSFFRSFMAIQAASMVGVSGIVFGLVRLT